MNSLRKSDRIQKLSEIAFATSHISSRKSDRIWLSRFFDSKSCHFSREISGTFLEGLRIKKAPISAAKAQILELWYARCRKSNLLHLIFPREKSKDTRRHDTTQNPSRRVAWIPRGKVTGHDTTRHRILREKSHEFLEKKWQDLT